MTKIEESTSIMFQEGVTFLLMGKCLNDLAQRVVTKRMYFIIFVVVALLFVIDLCLLCPKMPFSLDCPVLVVQ
jgi:hypothetical protein